MGDTAARDRSYGRSMTTRRVLAAALLTPLVGMGIAACDRPSPATVQQSRITNPIRENSINAQVGNIRLLGTRIDTAAERKSIAGSNVGLFTTIANDGDTPDKLVSVSSVYATKVVQRQGTSGPEQPVAVDIPGEIAVSLQYAGGLHLEMVELKITAQAGRLLPVTFTFEKAGSVTVNVFIDGFGLPTVSPPSPTTS
jgi:copper(I)-binding protein